MGTTTPKEPAPEPRRETFTEARMPAEPKSDVRMNMGGGMVLRERVQRVENEHGVSLNLTFTRLDRNDNVMLNSLGDPMISPVHEIVVMGELAGRADLTNGDIAKSLKDAREVAAAKAVDFFTGMDKIPALMASRLT